MPSLAQSLESGPENEVDVGFALLRITAIRFVLPCVRFSMSTSNHMSRMSFHLLASQTVVEPEDGGMRLPSGIAA